MTWTYAVGETDRDVIRDLVQDNDEADQLVSDEAIDKYLTGGALAQDDLYAAAAKIAGEIATKFVRLAKSVSAGGSRVEWENRAEFYRALSAELLAASPSGSASTVPYAGGISQADVLARESDTDRVAPYFARESGTLADPARWGR